MGKKGMTLLEMLVAIAVFVTGIAFVLRVFPGGLKGIRYGEQVTLATSLAKAELENLRAFPEKLPIAISAVNPDLPGMIDTGADPFNADPRIFRLIYGETFDIPAPANGEVGYASYYLLRFAPADPNWGIVIYSTPLSRAWGDPNSPEDIENLAPNQYLIDYDSGKIAFAPVPYERWFKVDYSYIDAQGESHDIVDEVLHVPSNSPYADDHPQGCLLGRPVDWFSETVALTFLPIAPQQPFSDNPYEYKIVDLYRGLIAFNPWAHRAIRSARVDYQVVDWRILREGRQLPFTLPATTRLTFPNLHAIDPADGYYGLLILDADTGEVIFDERNSPPCAPPDRVTIGKDGTLTFNYPADAGRRVRIFYRPSKDYPISIQKAATTYRREWDPTQLGWREYYLGVNPVTGRYELYFTPCEEGRVVFVDYEFGDPNNRQNVTGEWGTIRKVPERGVVVDGNPVYDFVVELKGQPVFRVYNVRGASLKVRAAWRSGDRWRKTDLDTILLGGW